MIQFKFDHRYVSEIDQTLKNSGQEKSTQATDSIQKDATKTLQLLPESELPFALGKHDDKLNSL